MTEQELFTRPFLSWANSAG